MSSVSNDDTNSASQLKPASDSVWYALATIHGEWDGSSSDTWNAIQAKNELCWNGMMRLIVGEVGYKELKKEHYDSIDLPRLSEEQLQSIEKRITDLSVDFEFLTKNLKFIDFSHVRLPSIDLRGFTFPLEVKFAGSFFQSVAIFDQSKFLEKADFEEVEFAGHADFKGCLFRKYTNFSYANFVKRADFTKSKFCHETDLRCSKIDYSLNFTKADFRKFPPKVYGAKLPENMSWVSAEFPPSKDLSLSDAIHQKDLYERLVMMMNQLHKDQDSHMFFGLQMRARRAMEWSLYKDNKQKNRPTSASLLNIAVNKFYECIADYGYGFGRALMVWCGIIVSGTVLLFPYSNAPLAKPSFETIGTAIHLWASALILSFSNTNSFFGLNNSTLENLVCEHESYDLVLPYSVTATIQTILGVVSVFFLLLTLRNRFRMR